MNNLNRMCSLFLVLSSVFMFSACGGDSNSGNNSDSFYKENDEFKIDVSLADDYIESDPNLEEVKGSTIYWLSYYDVNPINNQDRSVALSLFEEKYGGKVEYISCTSENKFDVLASRILSGDPVDMFPYEWEALPNGVVKNQYQPLDDYIDFEDDIWDGMEDILDMYEYKGSHYVVPYNIATPLVITYSRSMCEENGLPDPYELYEEGKWDWDVFMDMMTTFVSNARDDETRYGINGWFGQAMIQSTGETVINYDGEKFSNNIKSPQIESAENVMEEIMKRKLYDPEWNGYLKSDGSTLFFAMSDWALSDSNIQNDSDPDINEEGFVESNDIMVVPFPKSPDADKYYLNCNFGAKMLVKNSENGAAVGAYIRCERLASIIDEYVADSRQKALIPERNAGGVLKKYVTEEQYDALCEYSDPANITPVFDFGYGMGSRMLDDGEYTYDTRGIMNNITTALLNGDKDSWAVVRDEWSSVIDEIIKEYNET